MSLLELFISFYLSLVSLLAVVRRHSFIFDLERRLRIADIAHHLIILVPNDTAERTTIK